VHFYQIEIRCVYTDKHSCALLPETLFHGNTNNRKEQSRFRIVKCGELPAELKCYFSDCFGNNINKSLTIVYLKASALDISFQVHYNQAFTNSITVINTITKTIISGILNSTCSSSQKTNQ